MEIKIEHDEGTKSLYEKKDNTTLLLCDGKGRIVFVYGDTSVFEMKPSKMLQRNIFSLGFSQLSLLEMSREYPNGILSPPNKSPVILHMEFLSRNMLSLKDRKVHWRSEKNMLMKVLQLSCSVVNVSFSERAVSHRTSQVIRDSYQPKEDEEIEELALVEVTIEENRMIRTSQLDYEYVRQQIIQEIKIEELS